MGNKLIPIKNHENKLNNEKNNKTTKKACFSFSFMMRKSGRKHKGGK